MIVGFLRKTCSLERVFLFCNFYCYNVLCHGLYDLLMENI